MFLKSKYWSGRSIRPGRKVPFTSIILRMDVNKGYACGAVFVDNLFIHFMLFNTGRFLYSAESVSGSVVSYESGDFSGHFDSISAEFHGIRFQFSRESGKVMISDAFAGRREFDALTIE